MGWNTLIESVAEPVAKGGNRFSALAAVEVVLIGGDPGIGKSTLLLQVLVHLPNQKIFCMPLAKNRRSRSRSASNACRRIAHGLYRQLASLHKAIRHFAKQAEFWDS